MKPPRVAFVVDVPHRDLAGLVLTAVELCQRGTVCYLVSANTKEPEVFSLAPDLVLLNYLRKGNDGFGGRMVEAGIDFGSLDTEGGVWPTLESYTELLWPDGSLRAKARCVCMWGPRLAEYIVAEGLFGDEQVSVTGCPRFDFYHPTWHSVLAGGSNGREGAGEHCILINTNSFFANPRFTSQETIRGDLHRLFGWSDEKIRDIMTAQHHALEATIDMVRRLARDFPKARLVIRPHPYEALAKYHSRLGDVQNLEVNGEGPVQSQIARATVVVQRSCTTGIEAGLAGVPTISPQWVPAAFPMPTAESVSMPCDSYDQMRETLEGLLRAPYRPSTDMKRAIDTVVHDWFYRIDGAAYQRVSDVVSRVGASGRGADAKVCRRHLYGLRNAGVSSAQRIGANLRYQLHLPLDWSFRRMRRSPSLGWTNTDQFFGVRDVGGLVESIRHIRRQEGLDARPVRVNTASEAGEGSFGYTSQSVRLECRE